MKNNMRSLNCLERAVRSPWLLFYLALSVIGFVVVLSVVLSVAFGS